MVETVIDPIKVPVVTLSQAEIEEIELQIVDGILPADWLERHYAAVQANVFGHDHRVDSQGRPIEQGLGSAGNQTKNSVDAYRKWGVNDVDYEKNLSRMEKELATSNETRAARRKAEAAASPRRRAFQR